MNNRTKIRHLVLRLHLMDLFYSSLGIFTITYIAILAFLFFTNPHVDNDLYQDIFYGLQEFYLATLGVYVVIKEVRQKYHSAKSRHLGEIFVGAWVVLGIFATILIFSPGYSYNFFYRIILTNTVATLIFYLGGIFYKAR